MLFFLASILLLIWRTGASNDPTTPAALGPYGALAIRIVITGVLAVALIYFVLIITTLRKYAGGKLFHPRKVGNHLAITGEGNAGGDPGASCSTQGGRDMGDREKLKEKSSFLKKRKEYKNDADARQSPRLLELTEFGVSGSRTVGTVFEENAGVEVQT
jgi:hypothetical protein